MASTTHSGMHLTMGKADTPTLLAWLLSVVFLVIGVVGFILTGFDDFASEHGESLLGFHVNPLHNLVHLGLGVLGLAMAYLHMARLYGWLLFVGYGAVFVFGLFAVGDDDINFLALNGADNVLHAVLALAGLAIALWPSPARRATADNT